MRKLTHVDSQLPQVRVELTGETQAGGDARHDERDQVVQVTVLGSAELQGTEADVVERLVVNAEGLVGVLDKLMHRKRGVVGLNDSVRDLVTLV